MLSILVTYSLTANTGHKIVNIKVLNFGNLSKSSFCEKFHHFPSKYVKKITNWLRIMANGVNVYFKLFYFELLSFVGKQAFYSVC
jgi:hypothetical protein